MPSVIITAFGIGALMRYQGSSLMKAYHSVGLPATYGFKSVAQTVGNSMQRYRNLCCEHSRIQIMQWLHECACLKEAFYARWYRGRFNLDAVVETEIFVPEQSRLHAKTVQQLTDVWNNFSILLLSRFVGPEKINDNLKDVFDLIQEYAIYTDVGRLQKVIDAIGNAQQAVVDGKYAKLVDSLKGIVHPLRKHKNDLGKAINRSIDHLVDKLCLGRESLGRKAAENAYRVEAEREAIAEAVAKKVVEKTVIEAVVREAVAKEAARQAQEARERQKAAEALSARMSY